MSNRVAIMDMGAARDERDGSEYFFKGGEGKSQVQDSYRKVLSHATVERCAGGKPGKQQNLEGFSQEINQRYG